MRSTTSTAVLVAGVVLFGAAQPAAAQRYEFERTFAADSLELLDVTTRNGKARVTSGDDDEVVVKGTATVRFGWRTPANAAALAREVAANPPIARRGERLVLTPPADEEARAATTVAYEVVVPRHLNVQIVTSSGALYVAGIDGDVSVRTASSSIDLDDLSGDVDAVTESGALTVTGLDGVARLSTESSAIQAHDIRGDLRARTQSGSLQVFSAGNGDVDVQSGSSAIVLDGIRGGLKARTESGRITVHGAPTRDWQVASRSSVIDVRFTRTSPLSLDAATASGSTSVEGLELEGTLERRRAVGDVAGGGPLVRLTSRSGSIEISGER